MKIGDSSEAVVPSSLAQPTGPLQRLNGRLKGVVLLAGAVRQTELGRSIGRSILDLPVRAGTSVLDIWREQVDMLATDAGIGDLPIRVLIDKSSQRPVVGEAKGLPRISVESDSAELRGTGGVLRDIAAAYESDDMILVANAAQLLLCRLPELVAQLAGVGGDLSLLAHGDRSPVGLMLISCRVLREIKEFGFVDFKEQALPELARKFDVRVVTAAEGAAKSIRTSSGYLTALWEYHRYLGGHTPANDPFVEDWYDTFQIVEPGSTVDPTARLHDSVVLDGGRVGAGATLVRSVVCKGGLVRPGEVVTDRVVTASAARVPFLRR